MSENVLITDTELTTLEACQTAEQWRTACDAIKTARDGRYPADWWTKVKLSGLMDSVLARFGQSSEIRILPLDI